MKKRCVLGLGILALIFSVGGAWHFFSSGEHFSAPVSETHPLAGWNWKAASDVPANLVPPPVLPAGNGTLPPDLIRSQGMIAARLQIEKVVAAEKAISVDGRVATRQLLDTSTKHGPVVLQREFASASDFQSGLFQKEFAYAAGHILVQSNPLETPAAAISRFLAMGFANVRQIGQSRFFLATLAGSGLGDVPEALASLPAAEPDYLIFANDYPGESDKIVGSEAADLPVLDPQRQDWIFPSSGSGERPSYDAQNRAEKEVSLLSEVPAGSRILTFDPPDGNAGDFRPEVRMHNFLISTESGPYAWVFIDKAYTPGYPNNGGNYLRLLSSDGSVRLTHKDNLPFQIHSVDLSEYSTLYASPKAVTFTGYKSDGSSVSQKFTLDGVIDGTGPKEDFQTFFFNDSFSDIVRLVASSPPYQMDNFVVTVFGQETPLPPPPPLPLLYDVNWNDMPHEVGKISAVSGPYAISSHNFGGSLVRAALGPLTDRPLELTSRRPDGSGDSYGQIRFDLARNASRYVLEFDMTKTIERSLAVFFDCAQGFTRIDFNSAITAYYSGGAGGAFGSKAYTATNLNQVRIDVDLAAHTWKMWLNGSLIFSGDFPFAAGDVEDIRFSLSDGGVGGTAIDNVKISGYDLEESTPSVGPRLAILPGQGIAFPSTVIGGKETRLLQISNMGGQDLVITGLVSTNPQFAADGSNIPPIVPGGYFVVPVAFTPSSSGPQSGRLTLSCNDPASPSVEIPVSGSGIGIPVAALSPQKLDVSIVSGSTGTETFYVQNTGTAALTWNLINYGASVGPLPAPAQTNDPSLGSLWGLGDSTGAGIDARRAWTVTTGNSEVIVAVIDTGVDLDHPDLDGNLVRNSREIAGNGVDDDQNGYVDDVAGWNFSNDNNLPDDQNGHGTHVAGTIAAEGNNNLGVAGVAWSAKVLPVQFLSAAGSGYTSDAIAAIEYAHGRGAQIINASWGGGGYSSFLLSIIESFAQNGLFVAAAGNSAQNADTFPHYPSSYPTEGLLAVAATDSSDRLAYFSNYGRTSVDLAAPGHSILSCYKNSQYAYKSGTSMAAPHVSGAAALIVAKNAGMRGTDIKSLLLRFANTPAGLNDLVASDGRLNAYQPLGRVIAGWLKATPAKSSVAPGSSLPVSLSVDARNLAPGTHEATLAFATNDPKRSMVNLPITVAVLANSGLNAWKQKEFGVNNFLYEESARTIWDNRADPDGDTYSNTLEYLFGSSPLTPDRNLVSLGIGPDNEPAFVFSTRSVLEGVSYHIEWSPTLSSGSWRSTGLNVVPISTSASAGTTTWRASFKDPASTPAAAFFRVVVE